MAQRKETKQTIKVRDLKPKKKTPRAESISTRWEEHGGQVRT